MPRKSIKRVNPKEVVFLDEESDSSSKSSDGEEENSIINLVENTSTLSDSSDGNSSAPTPSDSDLSEAESEGREFDLDDAAKYFNRQNGEVRCRKCGNVGHIAVDCPLSQSLEPCIQCASIHHQVKNCPSNICRQCFSPLSLIRSCYQQGHTTRDCPNTGLPPQCIHCSSRLHRPEVALSTASHVELPHDASALRPLGVPARALRLLRTAGTCPLQEPAGHAGLCLRQMRCLWIEGPLLRPVQRPVRAQNSSQRQLQCFPRERRAHSKAGEE